MNRHILQFTFTTLIAGLTACQSGMNNSEMVTQTNETTNPEIIGKNTTIPSEKWMISVAYPYAAEAGLKILRQGGNAIDAAIAAQLVLNLVEPQSSGIGGGGFLVHFDANNSEISTYDGREKAPATDKPSIFV